MKITPSKDVPSPGGFVDGKYYEADIVLAIQGNHPGIVKSRRPGLRITAHKRDEHGDLIVALRYYDQ